MKSLLLFLPLFFIACAGQKAGNVTPPSDLDMVERYETLIVAKPSLAGREMSDLDTPVAERIEADKFLRFPISAERILALETSNDRKKVYLGTDTGRVYYVALDNFEARDAGKQLVLSTKNKVHSLSLSPDGKLLAIGQSGRVLVVNLETMALYAKLPNLQGRVTALAWDPRGQLLALGRSNGDILVWDLRSAPAGGLIREDSLELYRQSGSPVSKLRFHPLGRVFFAGHKNGEVVLWRLLRTEQEIGVRDHTAVADEDEVGRNRQTIRVTGRVTDLLFSEDQGRLYISSSDGTISVLKIRGLRLLGEFSDGRSDVSSLTLLKLNLPTSSGASTVLVSVSRDKQFDFWRDTAGNLELVAQSDFLAESTDILASSGESSYLWGVQKSGNLLGFNGDFLNKVNR